MRILIKKLLCLFLGHKIPPEHPMPMMQLSSNPVNGKRYVREIMACERCYSFDQSVVYTQEQWLALAEGNKDISVEASFKQKEKVFH